MAPSGLFDARVDLVDLVFQVVNPPVFLRRGTGAAIWKGLMHASVTNPLGIVIAVHCGSMSFHIIENPANN